MTTTATKARNRPPIQITETDADRLSDLAVGIEERLPQVAEMLMNEIERARIVPDGKLPRDIVGMMSTVRFVDETSGVERTVQLVYPQQADIESGRISILTPVGAGLIGLKEGQAIRWQDRGEHERVLRVIEVTPGT
ncbi:MAG: nucleoside diphosphate kinase regulator [Novosphingobium sp.]